MSDIIIYLTPKQVCACPVCKKCLVFPGGEVIPSSAAMALALSGIPSTKACCSVACLEKKMELHEKRD